MLVPQDTSHTSPSRASYKVSFVIIVQKTERTITGSCWIPIQQHSNTSVITRVVSLPLRTTITAKSMACIHSAVRRLTALSREVSKPQDSALDFYNRYEIWQASRQQYCRDAIRISERCVQYNFQSRGFETSRDLAVRHLTTHWIEAQLSLINKCC